MADRYVSALCRELKLRKSYLDNEPVETIYFGGGTPSQLSKEYFEKIFETIEREYNLGNCEEITLEANPDDLTPEYIKMLSSSKRRHALVMASFTWYSLSSYSGCHRLQGRKPASKASLHVTKKTVFSRLGSRELHPGRQKMPVVLTA